MIDSTDLTFYVLVAKVGSRYGVDPWSSIESEAYFQEVCATYAGPSDIGAIEQWLETTIARRFISLSLKPRWIQGPEWPIIDTQPAVFVGQLDIRHDTGRVADIFS